MTKALKVVRRSSKHTPDIEAEIVRRLSDGEPLAVMCRDAHMPDASTVWDWTQADERFAQAIAGARDLGHDIIAARTGETARGRGDSTGDVQRDKLIVETDLKLLAKWNPKRYGEKSEVAVKAEISNPEFVAWLNSRA